MSRLTQNRTFKQAIALTVMACFVSCVSVKKQRSRAEEFYRAHPEELAAKCANNFPPTYKPGKTVDLKPDTVYVKGDSVQCPPPKINPTTGQNYPPQKVACPPGKTIYLPQLRVDTVESTALLARAADLQQQNANLRADVTEKAKTIVEAKSMATSRLWTIVAMGAALIIESIVIVKKVIL